MWGAMLITQYQDERERLSRTADAQEGGVFTHTQGAQEQPSAEVNA